MQDDLGTIRLEDADMRIAGGRESGNTPRKETIEEDHEKAGGDNDPRNRKEDLEEREPLIEPPPLM